MDRGQSRKNAAVSDIITRDPPMWCDDFDMDLPKVFPDAREIFAKVADVEIVAAGRPDKRFGNLNHPHVWNGDRSMLAFFGFGHPHVPAGYITGDRHPQHVDCTIWDAVRDAWPHSYLIVLDGRATWDTFALRGQLQTLLCHTRGWTAVDPRDVISAQATVRRSMQRAARIFGEIVARHPEARRRT